MLRLTSEVRRLAPDLSSRATLARQ